MRIPSTDPRRFRILRRAREIAGDDLDDEAAREIATYEVLEAPSLEQRQAEVYREIRSDDRRLWRDVRDTLAACGVSIRLRREHQAVYAPVPTMDCLLRLYQEHIVPLLIAQPESELFETLAYVLQESVAHRLEIGVACGREHAQALFLRETVNGLQDTYEHARVGSSPRQQDPERY